MERTRQLIARNLYAGKEYWFSAGAAGTAKKTSIDRSFETGVPVAAKTGAAFIPAN